nr:retrovirus-related Pol polyprotein from transposon TNT 1-94 [Tanacetum cinerariifolium]
MLLYIKGKPNGKLLVDYVLNGPCQYGTIVKPRTETTPATVRARTYTNLTNEEKLHESVDITTTNIVLQETLILEEVSRSKMLAKQNDPISKEKKINTTNYIQLNQLSKDFDKRLVSQQELSTKQAFWLQTSHPNTDKSDISPVKIEAPRKLPKDVMLCVMNSTIVFGNSVNLEMQSSEYYDKCFDLDAKLLKKQNAYNELSKSYSQLENHCISFKLTMQLNQEIFQKDKSCNNQNALEISKYFENNDLKAQLQAKDTTIQKLKDHIKLMRENDKEEKVKQDMDEIKTINIELEHSLAKLLSENELLHKEIEHLKNIHKDQFDSIKKTYLKGQIQEQVFVTTALQNELRRLKVAVTPMNKVKKVKFSEPLTSSSNIHKQVESSKTPDFNTPVLPSTGLKSSTSASRSGNKKNDRISQTPISNMKNKVKVKLRRANLSSNKKNHVKDPICVANVKHTMLNANSKLICVKCKQCMLANHDVYFLDFINDVNVSSKSKSAKQSKQHNIWKPTGCPDCFMIWNDHIAKIMGYGDYQLGNVTISRVYYVDGLIHNLFSVGQFCDSDLEVSFWKNTCFIWNLDDVDLLSGSRDTNLYIISLDDMLKTSSICLLSKASKTKSWLWHRRLSHLNFGTINKLAKDGLARGIPKLKFKKDHLCSACALGKGKKSSHQPKAEDNNQEKLYLLHMDLCGSMHLRALMGKRPGLQFMTPAISSSGLVPNPIPQQPCIPLTRNDWDRLFQPMFDEYFNPPSSANSLVQVAATPRVVDLFDSLVSTSIDQDAPSSSIPSTQEQEQYLIIYHDVKESLKTPHFHDDPLHETLHKDSTSQGSSFNVRPSHTSFELLDAPTMENLYNNHQQMSIWKTLGLYKIRLSKAQILWGMYNNKNVDFVELLWEDFVFQTDNKDAKKQEKMYYPRFTKTIIHYFISKDKSISISSVWNTKRMTNQKNRDSPAYKTYLAFATGAATPKKARRFKKPASPSKKKVLVAVEELVEKPIKKPTAKRQSAGVQIRDTLGGSSEGTDLESEVPDEPKEDEFVHTPDDENVDDEEYECINKKMYEDVNMELKNAKPSNKEKGDEEITHAKNVNDEHEEVSQEVTGDQVKDDAHATVTASLATQKTEVPLQSSSISSDYDTKFLNFDNIPSGETKIISMMDIKVQHEDLSIQTSPLLTVPVTVIPESSTALATTIPPPIPPFISLQQQSTLIPTPTTTKATTSTTTVIQRHTAELIKEHFVLADVIDVLQQQQKPQKSAADIHKIKMEHAKRSLFKIMTASKTFNKHPKHKALYHALMESILADEDVMDKGIADILKKRKPMRLKEMKTLLLDQTKEETVFEAGDTQVPQDLRKDMGNINEPPVVKADPKDWFKKPKRPTTLDPEWNEGKTVDNMPTQKLLSDLAKAESSSKTFDDLMSTSIDFSAFKRVEDLQLGVASYQKKLNISKPRTRKEDLSRRAPYTTLSDPQGVIFEDRLNKKRLIHSDELYKFSDSKLQSVRDTLHDMATNLRMGDVIVVEDDHDVIHDNNLSDLELSANLNDLDLMTLNIDGQSTEVEDREPEGEGAMRQGCNYVDELVREFPMHYPSWKDIKEEKKEEAQIRYDAMIKLWDLVERGWQLVGRGKSKVFSLQPRGTYTQPQIDHMMFERDDQLAEAKRECKATRNGEGGSGDCGIGEGGSGSGDDEMQNETAKDLWDALERQMRGSEYSEQDRKAVILYEYEAFKATEGEQLLDTYLRYIQVINDFKKYGYKKDNCDVNDALGYKKKAVVITSYPLALLAKKTKVSKRKEKVVISSDSEGSGVDDFSELKNITALLAKDFNRRKFYSKPTNNNLRTSSTSQSANKKQEFVKSDDKKVEKKNDEKKQDMSKVKCYNCKKEGHFAKDCKKAKVKDYNYYKTKMLLAKKDSDEQVLLAEDQAWMESSSDFDQEINANMVFMAQIKKVLSDSDESYSSAKETIAEVAYYTSESESES